ncbi:PAS and ANTAR domain-containing protein [Nocardia sp. CDC159]|uniref:PAS and ANTAR domain-containing protein n=1 Tax=Nocardia pulmonis TaxID=2951408 RepID=A0A9X2IWU9_9NOCA|nr:MULTISPECIES: PAS and ANTAR domain-containing protein [Nocardia]MCM6773155.1 PAS and ANTAR domain-containing protein [Nocardia pulmonis]MCM6785542.1 PAS and ANTAR domain-containing protein [Nocardia sp. CDC159]
MSEPIDFAPGDAADVAAATTRVPTVGSFRVWFATRRWEWSEDLYRMHGYVPGEIEPTTELILRHKHPADREHVAALIDRSLNQREAFSSRHRFFDTAGAEHNVMVVADLIYDQDRKAVGTSGFYIDLTDTLAEARAAAVNATLPDVVRARAEIEQAKGVLMRMYKVSADQAFRVLVWRSQETNTKLRDLAQQLLADLDDLPACPPGLVSEFDHMLLTTHLRVRSRQQP